MEKTLLQKAIVFACDAHAGATRKGTDIPYIVHPIEVMKIVSTLTDDEEVRAAAVLHDTVEDTNVSKSNIENIFGKRVAELVSAESEDKRVGTPEKDTWELRKQETLNHLGAASYDAKLICLGDKLANMRDIARDYKIEKDKLWDRFNAPDEGKGLKEKVAKIEWYYRGIADKLKNEFSDSAAWQELDELINRVFHN